MSEPVYTDEIKIGDGSSVPFRDLGALRASEKGAAGGVASLDENGLIPISQIIDVIYPVDSYYETSNASFDPNVSFGGTWVREIAGMVHVSGGTGYPVAKANNNSGQGEQDGGYKSIIPYHTHVINRTANVGVTVAAHGITQPNFTIPNHRHCMGNNVWSSGNDGSTYVFSQYERRSPGTRYTNTDGGGGACTRTTNVALSNNHSVSVSQPAFSCVGTGDNVVDSNMQPYINIYRWHRIA